MDVKPLTIELTGGYTDPSGVVHKSVTFGNPITGSVLFSIAEDPLSSLYTQKELLAISKSITAFGSLTMPVALSVLLALDEFDIEDLHKGQDEFDAQIIKGRTAQFISDGEVKLSIGFERDLFTYPNVKFSHHVTGRDMAHADSLGFQGLKRACYLTSRQIESLTTEDGSSNIQGPIDIDLFNNLHSSDVMALLVASERWRDSFRRRRGKVQKEVGA
ncbi:MAG TPA: hypothetical protein VE732_06615 [Nitrososphaera sp.]|jgi:phage FluMu protein gp41|nr:hypothetical protein [Nitrososphaera sp.]